MEKFKETLKTLDEVADKYLNFTKYILYYSVFMPILTFLSFKLFLGFQGMSRVLVISGFFLMYYTVKNSVMYMKKRYQLSEVKLIGIGLISFFGFCIVGDFVIKFLLQLSH